MRGHIRRSLEIWKYTKSITITWKIVLLLGILPILGRVMFKKQFAKLTSSLLAKWGKDVLFTTPFGTFVTKTLNGWSVLTDNYEPLVKEVMLANYNKNKGEERVFINIGTHIWRRLVEFVSVYGYRGVAFEPSTETFKYLKLNTMLSNIEDKVDLYNFGLSNTEGTKKFIYLKEHDGHSHIAEDGEAGDNTTIETRVFDDLSLNIDMTKVRLIMIDVEWHEYNVLLGMQKTLKSLHKIDILMEVFDDAPNRTEVFALMQELGYTHRRLTHADYIFSK